MANQNSAFGLRPLKTVGQQDDSTGMSQYNILPGDIIFLCLKLFLATVN